MINAKVFEYIYSRIDWLIGFHPEYLDMLSPDLREAVIHDLLALDRPNWSTDEIFAERISGKSKKSESVYTAVSRLYELSRMGSLDEDIREAFQGPA